MEINWDGSARDKHAALHVYFKTKKPCGVILIALGISAEWLPVHPSVSGCMSYHVNHPLLYSYMHKNRVTGFWFPSLHLKPDLVPNIRFWPGLIITVRFCISYLLSLFARTSGVLGDVSCQDSAHNHSIVASLWAIYHLQTAISRMSNQQSFNNVAISTRPDALRFQTIPWMHALWEHGTQAAESPSTIHANVNCKSHNITKSITPNTHAHKPAARTRIRLGYFSAGNYVHLTLIYNNRPYSRYTSVLSQQTMKCATSLVTCGVWWLSSSASPVSSIYRGFKFYVVVLDMKWSCESV